MAAGEGVVDPHVVPLAVEHCELLIDAEAHGDCEGDVVAEPTRGVPDTDAVGAVLRDMVAEGVNDRDAEGERDTSGDLLSPTDTEGDGVVDGDADGEPL